MKIIGITGGSGAGKSTTVRIWESLGAFICNADHVYKSLLISNKSLLRDISAAFNGVLSEGVLDRRKLGEIVFFDQNELKRLNDITHPYIIDESRRLLDDAKKRDVQIAVLEAIYLLESEFAQLCDVIIGVISTPEKRLSRIMARDSLSRSLAWARIRSQASTEYYMNNCDIIINNSGTEAELEEKAASAYAALLEQNEDGFYGK